MQNYTVGGELSIHPPARKLSIWGYQVRLDPTISTIPISPHKQSDTEQVSVAMQTFQPQDVRPGPSHSPSWFGNQEETSISIFGIILHRITTYLGRYISP